MSEQPEKLEPTSMNIVDERIEAIRKIFPEVFKEGHIDFNVLQRSLGNWIDPGKERFGLNWPGKADCMKIIQQPSIGTLLPLRDQSVNFGATENIIIEGDNLEVLKLLQKSYYGKIKMIYIDPPYNTGNEFIYPDNFHEGLQDYLKYSHQVDENGFKSSTNTEANGRYHSKWLSMMHPRLFLAKNLLTEDGVIFVSIGNDEVHNLRLLLNEIFGEENFIEQIVWNKRIPKNDKGIGNIHEYILLYAKDSSTNPTFKLPKDGLEEVWEFVSKLKKDKKEITEAEKELQRFYNKRGFDRGITLYNNLDENFEIWGKINVSWPNGKTEGPRYEILHPITKKPVAIPDRGWRWVKETFVQLLGNGKPKIRPDGSVICGQIWFANDERTQPSLVKYLKDVSDILLKSIISLKSDGGLETEKLIGKNIFPYPKAADLITILIESFSLKDNDIVLDFFAGSGTTAHAVLKLNSLDGIKRKFILVQLPERLEEKNNDHKPALKAGFKNIAEITRMRVRKIIDQLIQEAESNKKSNQITDYGFRSYRLTSSNFKIWQGDLNKIENLGKSLQLFVEHVDESRTTEDILYELLLKVGYPLAAPIEKLVLSGKDIYSISEGALLICLDRNLTLEVVESMVKRLPVMIICLDEGFKGNDQLKVNVVQTIKSHNQNTESGIVFRVV